MDIDIRTLVLFYVIANAMNTGLIFIIWRLYRKQYNGLSFLLANMFLQTVGSLFLLLRGSIHDYLSIIIPSIFSVVGMLFILKGLEQFFSHKRKHTYNYILVSVYSILIIYFTTASNNLLVRNICLSAAIAIIAGQSWLLLSWKISPDERRITRFSAVVLLAYAVFSVGRIIALILFPYNTNEFFLSGIVNSVSTIAYSVLGILMTAGFIMMISRRLLDEVQTEKDKYIKAFHSSPYSLLLTNVESGEIFEVNEGFVRMTGYRPEEVIGKTTLELGLWANPDDRSVFVRELNHEDDVREKQIEFRMKSGAIIIGLLSAKKIAAFGQECILTSVSDITEMVRIKESLENIALHDTLTGLPNRQLFYDRAAIAIANAKRNKMKMAVISLDIDGLKYINDHWGHMAGDRVLVAIGNRLTELLRKGDTVSRFGGDEFLLLLNGINEKEDVVTIAKKLMESASLPVEVEGECIAATASLGIALYPADDTGIDALIRKSDEAMYYIKAHGRNGFRFYSELGK